jgi:cysteine dioxygenase type I
MVQNGSVFDLTRFEALADTDHDLTPEECATLARSAAALVDLTALERKGEGRFELLWRAEHSEAWLNMWWEPRDTGFHDHSGSCVGVYVLEGHARNEALVVSGSRHTKEYGADESFSFPGTGIHRMEHDRGAVTIHVYSPAIREIGHYEVVDGALHRRSGPPDEGSPPSPGLSAALSSRRKTASRPRPSS